MGSMRTMAAVLAVALLAASWSLEAQTAAIDGPKLSFEVASVKPNKSGSGSVGMKNPPDGFIATNVSLSTLVMSAYQLADFRILQGPPWMDSDSFDVTAKAAGQITSAQRQQMIRSLLADRFKFAAHAEMRELPVYSLVLAQADGRLGPGLRRTNIDCATVGASQPSGGAPRVAPCSAIGGPGRLHATAVRINQLIGNISSDLQRLVIDKTGLVGSFDIDLDWARNEADTTKPSIFTAVQEQLGLKLESSRAPTEVLVIDHVERPTPD
jgi:uncharacterized protein (TIGR03435 family)